MSTVPYTRTGALRTGAIAGMLTPIPVAITGVVILRVGENLRQYGMPWLLALSALLIRSCLAGVHAAQASPSRRGEAVGHAMTSAALATVAGFFAVLGLEDTIDGILGTGRFLSSNGTITAIGTLTGSVASLIVLPLGLCVFGVATARAHCLPSGSRWLPLAIPVTVVVGAATTSAASSSLVSLAWTWLVALACLLLGIALLGVHRATAQTVASPARVA